MNLFFMRLISVVMSILALISGGNPEKITMKTSGNITAEATFIEYTIENYSGRKCTLDNSFILEKQEDKIWVEIPFSEEYGFEEIAIICRNAQRLTFRININEAFGHKLEIGKYRLLKNVRLDGYEQKTLTFEFFVL